MKIKLNSFLLEIENLLIIVLISFFFSDTIKLFLTSYFVCYLFIIFHELSHIIFASLFGKKINKIKLSLAGVCVIFNNNDDLKLVEKLIMYIAGPIANICLAIAFYNIDFVFEINIFLAILNLVPVYPLDGYNILKCVQDLIHINVLKNVEYTFLSLLFFISIYILFYSYNPSLFIFFIYIMLIKYVTKNQVKSRK